MKEKIIEFINKQINLILELGKEDLVPSDYINLIINNYDFILNICTKENKNINNDISKSISNLAFCLSKGDVNSGKI